MTMTMPKDDKPKDDNAQSATDGCGQNLFDVDDLGRIISRITRGALGRGISFAAGFFQSLEGKIGEGISADVVANFVH